MAKYFYLGSNGWVVDKAIVPAGSCRIFWSDDETKAQIDSAFGLFTHIEMQPIEEFLKEDDNPYSDLDELLTAASDFFVRASDTGGTIDEGARTIYVESTGSDDDGDGTIGNPFLTFDHALTTVGDILTGTVVIQLGVGSFTCSLDSLDRMMDIQGITNVDLQIAGTKVAELTLTGLSQTSDPFVYDVTNTLTAGALEGMFVDGTSWDIPISDNGVNTIEVAEAASAKMGTSVFSLGSIFTIQSSDHLVLNRYTQVGRGGLVFNNLDLRISANKAFRWNAFQSLNKFQILGCKITAQNYQFYNINLTGVYAVTSQRGFIQNSGSNTIKNIVIKNNVVSTWPAFELTDGSILLDNVIIKDFDSGFANLGGTGKVTFLDDAQSIKFVGCDKAFIFNDGLIAQTSFLLNLVLDTTNYLYECGAEYNVNAIFVDANIIGSPVTAYVYNDNSQRVRPDKNYLLYVVGVHSPEISYT